MQINWKAVGAVILPNVGGWLGAITTRQNMAWYESLNKPAWRPPNWAFGPVWTCLYSSMGYASYLVYRDGGGFNGDAKIPLMVYGGQLVLNWVWTPIFFGGHNIRGGFYDILFLDAAAAATGYLFYKINPTAGYIFIPYLLWLSVATSLNLSIWQMNPEEDDSNKAIKDM